MTIIKEQVRRYRTKDWDDVPEDAQKVLIERERKSRSSDGTEHEEASAAGLELYRVAGLLVRGWQLGGRGSYVDFTPWDVNADLSMTGARAMAWLENNVLGQLRNPWERGPKRRQQREYLVSGYTYWRGKGMHPSAWNHYKPGHIEPCALTGEIYGDVALTSLVKGIVKDGMSVNDALLGVWHDLSSYADEAAEAYVSDEAIVEHLSDVGEYEFVWLPESPAATIEAL